MITERHDLAHKLKDRLHKELPELCIDTCGA
jgi:hypothetical protein